MRNTYNLPCRVEPKRHRASVGRLYGALGGKRGSARCELKRPSFGCLTPQFKRESFHFRM